MSNQSIPASELPGLLREGKQVIDVRSPAEYRQAHVKGAELVPLDQLDANSFCSERGKDKPVYILCQSGKRASMAAKKLRAAGHEQATVVEGGTDAAIEQGLDVEYGKKVISIERQVRIVAGTLVVIGTLAGAFMHPAWLIVPGFIGAGLTFAGITDTCGMGMMLAKCPWNR